MFRGFEDENGNTIMDKEYLGHAVFRSLSEASNFYHGMADSVMCFEPQWVKSHPIVNYDSYFFEALANTIVSIKTVLELGHITDAKTLLRSFFDEAVINLYFMARLKRKDDDFLRLISDNAFFVNRFKAESLYDVDTSDWLAGNKTKQLKKTLRYEEMRCFLKQDTNIAGFVDCLDSPEYRNVREWLNDAVHLNHYKTVLLNDGLLGIDKARKSAIDAFEHAFEQIAMFHATCVFCLEPVYLMSSDYKD